MHQKGAEIASYSDCKHNIDYNVDTKKHTSCSSSFAKTMLFTKLEGSSTKICYLAPVRFFIRM